VQNPNLPPKLPELLRQVSPERWVTLLEQNIKPEVGGQYLHWEELQRRPPPEGLTTLEWWLSMTLTRRASRIQLPFLAADHSSMGFSRTDALQRLLHEIDRDVGGRFEVSDPQLANLEQRDRYIMQSLMEEAITSSQLEGAATTRKVAKEMLLEGRAPRTPGERMIANNFRAMEFVRSRLDQPLTPTLLLEVHTMLTQDTLQPSEVGRVRRADENVLVQDNATGLVLHVPPPADELPQRIEAVCRFANEREDEAFIHPVVRAIALHFALAYDHPFVDGNGRTARAIFYWSMLRQGYRLAEFLSISRVIQKAPARYGQAFLYTETDGGDLTYFLIHQLTAIRRATADLRTYLQHEARLLRETDRILKEGLRFNPRQRSLLSHALRHPNARYTIQTYRREQAVVYQTARADLLGLVEAGLLRKTQVGRAFHFEPAADLERKLERKGRRGDK
jgi:Fic family protein